MVKHLLVITLLLSSLTSMAFCLPECRDVSDTVYVQDATNLILPQFRPLARALAVSPASIPTAGNDIEIITNGLRYRELLTSDYLSAKDYIEIECFLFGSDTSGRFFRKLLTEKVREGVQVRYTHDNFGNLFDNIFDGRPFFNGYYTSMRKDGVDLRNFATPGRLNDGNSPLASRNHRKISVIDGKVAYVGGMNINDGSLGAWEDTHMRVTGPAVMNLRALFLQNWNMLAGGKAGRIPLVLADGGSADKAEGPVLQVFADGPDMDSHSVQDMLVWALENASRYVYMETPYFVPTSRVLRSMKRAAARGLDVRILLPRDTDMAVASPVNHSFYKTCVKSGVRIFERVDRFVHSKVFIVDDYMLYIGSSNLDQLSLRKLYEAGAIIYDQSTAEAHARTFLADLQGCEEVTEKTFAGWSAGEKFKQKAFKSFSYWL